MPFKQLIFQNLHKDICQSLKVLENSHGPIDTVPPMSASNLLSQPCAWQYNYYRGIFFILLVKSQPFNSNFYNAINQQAREYSTFIGLFQEIIYVKNPGDGTLVKIWTRRLIEEKCFKMQYKGWVAQINPKTIRSYCGLFYCQIKI